MTEDVFILDAVRTPIGRHGGALAGERPDDLAISLGEGAELLASKYSFSREEQDAFALRGHHQAAAAWDARKYEGEVRESSARSRTSCDAVEEDSVLRQSASASARGSPSCSSVELAHLTDDLDGDA